MKTILLHSDFIEFEPKKKAMKAAEEVEKKKYRVEDCLVAFNAVEKKDEASTKKVAENFAKEVEAVAKEVKAKNIVIYPWVHLTPSPSAPAAALNVMKKAESILGKKFKVTRAPFGWYKAFDVKCKGHPLSELSRDIGAEKKPDVKKERKEGSEFSKFILVDKKGKEYEVTPKTLEKAGIWKNKDAVYKLLRQFAVNEVLGAKTTGKMPKHVEYMRQHELVDYCDASEPGHYKWYPKGVLIKRLLLAYARKLSKEWGALEMSNPLLIRGDHNVVGELMGEFHERDYKVDGGRGIGYLRYASDPLGFPFLQKVSFSYKQSPLKVYEEATCFRNEQAGEVSGLKRVRHFLMTDMHAACSSEEEARKEFERLCYRFGELMNDIIAKGRWVLGWEGTEEFYEKNKKFLISIGRKMGVPAFFKLMPEMSHYYAIKNEYQTILEDKSNIQVSTVQWDTKDGKRFDIGYIGDDGKKHPCPVIIHASSFGSIERTLCSILENIAIDEEEGKSPMLPLWLSPTQVRVIPISDKQNKYAGRVADELSKADVRADVDDRDLKMGKKIREAELEWTPYMAVAGEKEQKKGMVNVRDKRTGRQREMKVSALARLVKKETEGMPYRPLPLPRLLSLRPKFVG